MKISLRFLFPLLLAVAAVAPSQAAERALPNPFGVFNLRPLNGLPAQEQVDLAQRAGYAGLMASTSVPAPGQPLARLREFTSVPAVRDGKFKIYAILWQVRVDKPLDENFLKEFTVVARELKASIWCNAVGTPGEREVTVKLLQAVADQCAADGVQLVLYPHHACTFETAEESIDVLKLMQRPQVKLSLHLCHELKANNRDRLDAVVGKIAPHLALVSLNGVDTSVPFSVKGWDSMILPLDQGDYDVRPFVAALMRHGYTGPILLHNFGFKAPPAEYLPASMARWNEIGADVAKQIAAERAAAKK